MRKFGFPDDVSVVNGLIDYKFLKLMPEYAKAKSGCVASAQRLVRKTVPAPALAAAESFGADVIYLPVSARYEDGSRNAIPVALAAHYAYATGGLLGCGVVQANRAYHTGANPMERLLSRAEFTGKVIRGGRYVIVDDVTTMGSTVADLSNFIRSNGGLVVGCVLLASSSRAGIVNTNKADRRVVARLEESYGATIRELFSIEPAALTRDESSYLIGFRSDDELRHRAATARAERASRITAKSVSWTAPVVEEEIDVGSLTFSC